MPSGAARRPSASPRCQVHGCTADLTLLRPFYARYRVCEHHAKVEQVELNSQLSRFCQLCGKFHTLDEFEASKRSCIKQLQRHTAVRRARVERNTHQPSAAAGGTAKKRSCSAPTAAGSPDPIEQTSPPEAQSLGDDRAWRQVNVSFPQQQQLPAYQFDGFGTGMQLGLPDLQQGLPIWDMQVTGSCSMRWQHQQLSAGHMQLQQLSVHGLQTQLDETLARCGQQQQGLQQQLQLPPPLPGSMCRHPSLPQRFNSNQSQQSVLHLDDKSPATRGLSSRSLSSDAINAYNITAECADVDELAAALEAIEGEGETSSNAAIKASALSMPGASPLGCHLLAPGRQQQHNSECVPVLGGNQSLESLWLSIQTAK